MADAVGSTLGPRGQNVGKQMITPTGEVYSDDIIHDGVTVARSIQLSDTTENFAARILRQTSQKQVDAVGDGTTVVMILAQALIQESFKLIAAGVNPMALRQGLEQGCSKLVKELESMALPIKNLKDMKFIARISSEDEKLGDMVAEILDKVGKDAVVDVQESKLAETEVEHQVGMQLDKGFLHPLFCTNPEMTEAVWENAYILVTDKSITNLTEIGKFLEAFVKVSKKLVIISPDISGEALPLFIQNKMQGNIFTLCIQAPSFGDDQKNILQDIATLTGGKFWSQDAGFRFEDLTVKDLGFAANVTSTKKTTIISGGKGKKEEIEGRVEKIKQDLSVCTSDFDGIRLKSRLGKLTSGVAVIRVGGQTEVEMKERRERILDAVAATRAGMEKGIVPGGEIVFLHIRNILDKSILAEKLLYDALYRPFKKLIDNAGISETEMAVALDGKSSNYGVDVTSGKVRDMVKAGIVDPVLVPICALNNAVSVAVQLMTSGCIIVPHKLPTEPTKR